MVITRPTPSVALENFILERCENDAHIAVIVRDSLLRFPQGPAQDTSQADFNTVSHPADSMVPAVLTVRLVRQPIVRAICSLPSRPESSSGHHLYRSTRPNNNQDGFNTGSEPSSSQCAAGGFRRVGNVGSRNRSTQAGWHLWQYCNRAGPQSRRGIPRGGPQ